MIDNLAFRDVHVRVQEHAAAALSSSPPPSTLSLSAAASSLLLHYKTQGLRLGDWHGGGVRFEWTDKQEIHNVSMCSHDASSSSSSASSLPLSPPSPKLIVICAHLCSESFMQVTCDLHA